MSSQSFSISSVISLYNTLRDFINHCGCSDEEINQLMEAIDILERRLATSLPKSAEDRERYVELALEMANEILASCKQSPREVIIMKGLQITSGGHIEAFTSCDLN